MGPVTSNTIYGFRSDIMLNLLSMYGRTQHPTANDMQIKQLVPLLLTQLHEKMNLGDTSVRHANTFKFLRNYIYKSFVSDVCGIGSIAKSITRLHNGFQQYDWSNEFTKTGTSNEHLQPIRCCCCNESATIPNDASPKSINGIEYAANTSDQYFKCIIKSSNRTRLISFPHLNLFFFVFCSNRFVEDHVTDIICDILMNNNW